jgi:hypothetical protein
MNPSLGPVTATSMLLIPPQSKSRPFALGVLRVFIGRRGVEFLVLDVV